MQIEIRGRAVELTQPIKEHVERRLSFALGRFGTQVRSARVRLEDLNGPKGGLDKRCRVTLSGDLIGQSFVEATDADLYTAIDRAAGAAGRAVSRSLERANDWQPTPPSRGVAA